MDTFNPETFLNTVEVGANSTSFEPIPDGEYLAHIPFDDSSLKPRVTNKGQLVLDITWELLDEALKAKLDRTKVTVRQSLFIDQTPQGTIDRSKGKNVQLGRLREALGQNDPLKPWQPSDLRGAGPAKIKVSSRLGDDGTVYNDVKAVAPAT
jgi:hypothetical protein